MCGIAGIIHFDGEPIPDEQPGRMSAAIAHRGPDHAGLFWDHDGHCAVSLVHRRLAVLDPSERSNEPFEIDWPAGRRVLLVFNGEIYNYRELRRELVSEMPDYLWRTTGDTEVLAAAYAVWGSDCLDKLEGMFAFAAWDARRRQLFLARDRMGQKPLYLAVGDQRIAFASEPAALRMLPWVDLSLRPEGLVEYLRYGYATQTIHNGLTQLPPGSYCLCSPDQFGSPRRYFDPNDCESRVSDREVGAGGNDSLRDPQSSIRDSLISIVGRQLVSDVPLGCFLSGGIDSSIIAACARAHGPLTTFCIGFDDPRYDESPFARAVARHLQTDHHEFRVTIDAAADLPMIAARLGEPFGDSSLLPTYYLSREARRHVTVALSGDGGDELFGGYERYRAMRLGARLDRLPPAVRRVLARLGRAMPDDHPKSLVAKSKRFLVAADRPPAGRYLGLMRLFDDPLLAALLGLSTPPPDPLLDSFDALAADRDVAAACMALDRVSYLPGDLLAKVDRASMMFALEVRCPFMDHTLVRRAGGLDIARLLAGGGKRPLREAFVADLPAWVFTRPKMGFAVPIGRWFRAGLREMLHDHLLAKDSFASTHLHLPTIHRLLAEHHGARQDHAQRLYSLLMLELWQRAQCG